MLDKEEVKASEEVVENIEKEKEEEKVKEVNDEKVSEDETDKINEFVEEDALKNKEEEIDKSAKEDKEEKTKEDEVHNDIKDKVGFLQYFKEGIKNTLGIFVVSIGFSSNRVNLKIYNRVICSRCLGYAIYCIFSSIFILSIHKS